MTPTDEEQSLDRLWVLIVDDDLDDERTVELLVQSALPGSLVVNTRTPDAALQLLEKAHSQVHIIIVDDESTKDPRRFIEQAQRLDPDAPIIVTSGHGDGALMVPPPNESQTEELALPLDMLWKALRGESRTSRRPYPYGQEP